MCSLYRSDGVSNSWLRFPSVSTRRDEVPGGVELLGVSERERDGLATGVADSHVRCTFVLSYSLAHTCVL